MVLLCWSFPFCPAGGTEPLWLHSCSCASLHSACCTFVNIGSQHHRLRSQYKSTSGITVEFDRTIVSLVDSARECFGKYSRLSLVYLFVEVRSMLFSTPSIHRDLGSGISRRLIFVFNFQKLRINVDAKWTKTRAGKPRAYGQRNGIINEKAGFVSCRDCRWDFNFIKLHTSCIVINGSGQHNGTSGKSKLLDIKLSDPPVLMQIKYCCILSVSSCERCKNSRCVRQYSVPNWHSPSSSSLTKCLTHRYKNVHRLYHPKKIQAKYDSLIKLVVVKSYTKKKKSTLFEYTTVYNVISWLQALKKPLPVNYDAFVEQFQVYCWSRTVAILMKPALETFFSTNIGRSNTKSKQTRIPNTLACRRIVRYFVRMKRMNAEHVTGKQVLDLWLIEELLLYRKRVMDCPKNITLRALIDQCECFWTATDSAEAAARTVFLSTTKK